MSKTIELCLFFLLLSVLHSHASTLMSNYDIRLQFSGIDCAAKTACYDIQLRSSSGVDWGLAGQNYRLYYDASIGRFISATSLLDENYQAVDLRQDIHDIDASDINGNLSFEENLGFVNFSIDLINTSTGGETLLGDGSWVSTAQVCFEVEEVLLLEPSTCFEVVWARSDMTAPYATSFVEVSEWVSQNNTINATGNSYLDVNSGDEEGYCFSSICLVRNYDLQLAFNHFDCNNATACYDVQIKSADDGNWYLGNQDYHLYYDASFADFATATSELSSNYSPINVVQTKGPYNANGNGNIPFENQLGYVHFAVDLNNPNTNPSTLVSTDDWLTTSQVCFQMNDSQFGGDCFETIWARMGLTDSYESGFTRIQQWEAANKTKDAESLSFKDITNRDAQGSCFNSPFLSVSLPDDLAMCNGQFLQLRPTIIGGNGNLTYNWQPSESLDNSSIESPTARPTSQTTYNLSVSDDYNCVDNADITIDVTQCSCGIGIQLVEPLEYNDNNTPINIDDDTYTFKAVIRGNGTNGWIIDTDTGNYNQVYTFGPFPVTSTQPEFQARDKNNPEECNISITLDICECLYLGTCDCCPSE